MLPFERHKILTDIVRENKTLSIKDLADKTNIPITTLRRDINTLSEQGKLLKLRGAVSVPEQKQQENISEQYTDRKKLYHEEKHAIAKTAQNYINSGDIIILSYGTTVSLVAKYIDIDKEVTVITNGLDIVEALKNKHKVKVILLGGIVDYSNNTVTGPTVPKMLDEFNPSKIIIGAGGITEEKGITNYDFLSSAYYSELIKGVDKIIVVADHSKFGRNVLTSVIHLNEIDTIITDNDVDKKYHNIFDKYGIDLVLAPLDSN